MRRCRFVLALLLVACGNSGSATPDQPGLATREQLMNPNTCKGCHPTHFDQWSGSMHAYASDDPVFIAMNERGQRETGGALGDFCLKCHAPLAVYEAGSDGGVAVDPATLPPELKGVNCFFCHSVDGADEDHPYNNSLHLADDLVLRGGIPDPVENGVHAASYSALHDGRKPQPASRFCGSCHDIVTTKGGHVERTYDEWGHSLYAKDPPGGGPLSCGGCHMPGQDGLVADGVGASGLQLKLRKRYDHSFPAVDVALTEGFPHSDDQRNAVEEKLEHQLLQAAVCVNESLTGQWSTIDVYLDNIGAGHNWPSGATQDRRAWVELIAYKGGTDIYHSGTDKNGQPLTFADNCASGKKSSRIIELGATDPDLWLIRDCMFAADGQEVHMFWEAASSDPNQLPVTPTLDPSDPAINSAHVLRTYPLFSSTPSTISEVPDRVTLRVLLQPIGLDVLDLLTESGDLDCAVLDRMPTFSVLRPMKGDAKLDALEWNPRDATTQPSTDPLVARSCVSLGSPNFSSNWYPPAEHKNSACRP